jgi:hypothetical protein
MYLGDTELSSAGDSPGAFSTPDFGGVDARGGHMGGAEGRAGTGGPDVGEDSEGASPTGASVQVVPYL